MFQRISAAYQKLSKDEESDEEDGDDDDDFDYEADVLYEFFAYMQAKMEAQHAQRQRRHCAGCGFRRGAHSVGAMRGIPIPTPFGFMYVEESSFRHERSGPSHRYTTGKPHQPHPSTARFSRKDLSESETDSDEWETDEDYCSESDMDDMFEREKERTFFQMEAEERAREQERVRAKYEAALRGAREASLREKSWLQQLPRPARTSYTEHSIVLSVDRGAKSGMADFTSGKLPEAFFWEIQHRPHPHGQQAGDWITEQIVTGVLETEVGGLHPGTKYSFRARPCKRDVANDEEVIQHGEWSVESNYVTAGTAATKSAAEQQSELPPQPSGKNSSRKSRTANKETRTTCAISNPERDEARKVERMKAQEEKDAAIRAAVAAAAADYEAHTAASASQDIQGKKSAAEAYNCKEKKKKKPHVASKAAPGPPAPPPYPTCTSPGPAQPAVASSFLFPGTSARLPTPPPAPPFPKGALLGGQAAQEASGAASGPAAVHCPHYDPSEWEPVYAQDHPARPRTAGPTPAMLPPTRAPGRRGGEDGGGASGAGPGRSLSSRGSLQACKPSQAGLEAASSGSDAARQRVAQEAARQGMTVQEYIAHQDDLALQEAIQLSLALEESRAAALEEAASGWQDLHRPCCIRGASTQSQHQGAQADTPG